MIELFHLLNSQSAPLKPDGQAQVYVAIPSVQFPPLLQGFPMQSFTSVIFKD